MKALTQFRLAALRVVVAALVLLAGVGAFVSASSLPTVGHTGQALALRSALHPEASSAAVKRFFAAAQWPHLQNGRLLQPPASPFGKRPKPQAASNANPIIINSGVQTFDLFAPPPSFVPPTGPLSYVNKTPVWSADESYILFSSNRPSGVATDPAGNFHIWGVAAKGGAVFQVTSGQGNEYYPTLDTTANNNLLAFTSDANSLGNQNLYVISFTPGAGPTDVATLNGNPASSKTLGDTNLSSVTRPTFSPGSDRIAFAALTPAGTPGHTGGFQHIFYLYVSNNGYQAQPAQGLANPPAQLTDGPANDADPAWSPDGNYIIFDSFATSYANTGNQISPMTAPAASQGSTTNQRSLFLINGGASAALGTVTNALPGGRVTVAGNDSFAPAWSNARQNQYFNPNGTLEYISFARSGTASGNHDIYYFRLEYSQQAASQGDPIQANRPLTAETYVAGGNGGNDAVRLNTDDPNNDYDDTYPTWAPFQSVFSIAYQSPRSVTYNSTTPTAANIPSETAINLPPGTNGLDPSYIGLLESQVLNLDPPTLLRYSGAEVIRVTDENGNPTRNIQPSVPGQRTYAKFIVRLSDREAGTDPTKVFLQIKDPDSRYQDSQGLEHKVFANSNDTFKDPATGFTRDYGTGSARRFLFNGGGGNGIFNINNALYGLTGAVGGWDPKSSSDITVGHQSAPVQSGGGDLSSYQSWGPEYECQYVNPTVLDPGTNAGDYGVPYYLAGIDDQEAFSGSVKPPRPTTNDTTRADVRNQHAQWLPLTPLPAAQQDNQGGTLYGLDPTMYPKGYTTPISASDFYLDVIAYDQAKFPAIEAFPNSLPLGAPDYHGRSINWRIYDNVGGFTTATFNGSNDILVVIDNGLGQKFSATTFGGQNGNSNLIPAFFGAESYYTDVDERILPNCIDMYATDTPPVVPANPPAPQQSAVPQNVKAYPNTGVVTLQWSGVISPANTVPDSYRIYRSLAPFTSTTQAGVTLLATVPGNSPTQYVDNAVQNNIAYYYAISAVFGTTETGLSQVVSATPRNYAGVIPTSQQLTTFNTLNGLGVGSYDDGLTDDNGKVSVLDTDTSGNPINNVNLPNGSTTVPFVRSQKYSIWRILSRGTIPPSVLAGYQPNFQTQPAVADTVNNVNVAANAHVPVANRCVFWVSPYTGALPLVDAGSLENPTTQDTLQAFVQSGGRLCITGQNVASSLSLGGSSANTFLAGALGAKFASQNGGNQILGGSGARVSGYPGFNGGLNIRPGYEYIVDGSNFVRAQAKPSANPLLLGNDEDYNRGDNTLWRADSSLDQLGPFVNGFSVGFNPRADIEAVAQINTITASGLPNTTQDMTTNGNLGLLYYENYNTNADGTPAAGYGSRVVFGSFGLEGISQDYYRWNDAGGGAHWDVHNQRSNILHNIVCYLRTGTFTGRITQASGQGVAGATVYLRPAGGALPGPRQLFSATTAFDGSYTISGVEPGTYSVTSYKSGFSTTTSNVIYSVEGDTLTNVGLVIAPVPPGRINGKVTDSTTGAGVNGVTVTFKSADGQTTVSAVTGPDGTYNIDNVPIGPYSGVASKQPQYTDAVTDPKNPPVVQSGQTTTVNFAITPKPATVSGIVFNDQNGDGVYQPGQELPVPGATVTFTPQNTAVPTPPSVKSDANGNYTITGLAPGTYTITATAPGLQSVGVRTVTVQPGDTLTGRDIPLIVVPPTPPGYLGGLVSDAYTGKPLAGATVTVYDATGKQVAQVIATGTTTTLGAPQGDNQPVNYGPIALPPGQYAVVATLAGFSTQTLTNLTVVSNAFTRADFTGTNGNPLQPLHVFPAGYNFFSVPYDYAAAGVSIDQIFGPLNTGTRAAPSAGSNRSHVFVWSPQLLQYVLDPTPPADGLHLGQGYWIYLINPVEVTRTGNLPTTTTIPVGLHRGWNQIGVPSLTPISVSRVSFANPTGGGSIPFGQAITSQYHLISPTLYGYNGTGYLPLSTGGSLQPWQSYWIYAYADTTALLPTGGG